MVLVWRGMGILAPITLVVSSLLTAWISGSTAQTLGESGGIIGWGCLWTAIVCALVGLATFSGKDENGSPGWKNHTFFWIPVIAWSVIFGGLSLYLLVFSGSAKAETPEPTNLTESIDEGSEVDENPEASASRIVNFYNPTNDTITYIVADETADGLLIKEPVAPNSFMSKELEEGTYLFSSFDQENNTLLVLPATEEDAKDTNRFTKFKDDKGEFYQRIVGGPTEATDDYDEAWLVLDGKTDILVVYVTDACAPDYTLDEMKKDDWATAIAEELDSRDLVEPMYNAFIRNMEIKVVAPGAKIPTEIEDNWIVCLLVPYHGEKNKDAVIEKAVKAARF